MADDWLLVEAAQKDPAHFAELYECNFERIYTYVVKRVGDRAETEDLTAEVFHHALAKLESFEWRGVPFAAWLYRIAANLIADRWQRKSREKELWRIRRRWWSRGTLQYGALSALRERTEGAHAKRPAGGKN